MLKLIKLEWKKNNIGKYVRNAVILFQNGKLENVCRTLPSLMIYVCF